ncbi:MAG: hypothetical protein MJ159_04065 [Treponemataceae bacterium]|nr:hypothetical protein [Treponemataceae bacterium]
MKNFVSFSKKICVLCEILQKKEKIYLYGYSNVCFKENIKCCAGTSGNESVCNAFFLGQYKPKGHRDGGGIKLKFDKDKKKAA